MPNLQTLDASQNRIVFISSSINKWAKGLIKLKLSKNKIWEIPTEIVKLKNLRYGFILTLWSRYLKLNDNELQFLPSDISELKYLKQLDISNNRIEMLPYSIGDFEKLKVLNISNNWFHAIPTSLHLLKNLEQIEFEWLVYAPKLVDLSEQEHGQSESKPKLEQKYGMKFRSY